MVVRVFRTVGPVFRPIFLSMREVLDGAASKRVAQADANRSGPEQRFLTPMFAPPSADLGVGCWRWMRAADVTRTLMVQRESFLDLRCG